MKLLTQVVPVVRQAIWSSTWFTPVAACGFLGLELFGRLAESDVMDVLGIGMLMCLTILVLEKHRSRPMPWLTHLGRWLERMFSVTDALKFEMGIDFRGSPPIRRRVPPLLLILPVILASVTVLALVAWTLYPRGPRQLFSQISYIGYLVGLMVLWGTILLSAFVGGVFLPVMVLEKFLPPRSGQRVTRIHIAFVSTYIGLLIAARLLLPFWVITALCGLALVAVAAGTSIPTASGVQFIWRRDIDGPIRSVSSRKLILCLAATIVLGLTSILALSCGALILGLDEGAAAMPFTRTIGEVFGWLVPGILFSGTALLWMFWMQNPSRPCRPSIHVADVPRADRREVRRILRSWGWSVHSAPVLPGPDDLRIRLVSQERSQAEEFQPEWPLAVSLADLRGGTVRERLQRRDELRMRRRFLRGIEKLFRSAAGRRHPGGSGYWLAPHQWLLQGMLRDDMEENDAEGSGFLTRPVGTPYGQLLPRSVRHYLHTLMNALQIDLIFVEDGVGYRKLKRVMRAMFEIYDKSAGRRRVEEAQLSGLPRVKVMIHEFLLDRPFTSELYPEPRFENLGRARILHVFRDRGEDRETAEPPFDFSWEPEPLFV